MSIKVNYLISDRLWDTNLLSLKRLANKAIRIAEAQCINRDFYKAITINLSNDEELKFLNFKFREKNKPTNVLSFHSDEEKYLGDIAMSYETIERESIEQQKLFKNHFVHMVVHSFLHLCGYDHKEEEEAQKMEILETEILTTLGIADPYK